MSEQPRRLDPAAPHGFGGGGIDRGRPIRFRLDGRRIDGFAGDTVLSAALAAGIGSAGSHDGHPVALDQRTAPAIVAGRDATARLPMSRTPATDGADYSTAGLHERGLGGLVRRRDARSLSLRLGEGGPTAPWQRQRAQRTIETDLLVVGGGVAGLAAAAASRGRVVLVERQPHLGGSARFFGSVEGEDSPDDAIARLTGALGERGDAEILTATEVFALHGREALAHRVWLDQGTPRGEVVRIVATKVVLATGCVERLPVFPGNRSPGVVGAVEAHRLAERFGVWLGRRTAFATPHNFTYQLALHARDAGAEVLRVADPRLAPRSRYIDFCKASGLPLAAAVRVSRAVRRRDGSSLDIGFAVAIDDIRQDAPSLVADLLVAAGGLQPDLGLWLEAGGGAGWDAALSGFLPTGRVADVALAGSVTGLQGTAAAIASGESAIVALGGKRTRRIADRRIDAEYESGPAPTPVSQSAGDTTMAYLDGGTSFTTQDAAMPHRQGSGPSLVERAIGFSICDIAAAVELGAVPPASAGALVGERCVVGGEILERAWRVQVPPPASGIPPVPAYLTGRFGPSPKACVLAVDDSRFFEPGCLVFASSDASDPRQAIGVVYAAAPGERSGGLALIGDVPDAVAATVFVRDAGGVVAARIMERLKGV